MPAFGFGHQRSSSSSSFGSPTGPSGVGFRSPTGSSGMGFGSPTGSSATFTYPTVASRNVSLSTSSKEASSDNDDKAPDEYVVPANVTQPQYSDVASKMMVNILDNIGLSDTAIPYQYIKKVLGFSMCLGCHLF